MKEKIDKYIAKKRRKAIIKLIKKNLPTIFGVLAVIIILIVLKVVKKKTKKKVKAMIKDSIKKEISSLHNRDEYLDDEEE